MASSRKAGARGSQRSETLPPLAVRYMRRMKRQKVYSYEVSWKGASSYRGPASPVVVRLVVAGAQVVPAERSLDPAKPDVKAVFFVTPLAKGWLRGERVEVLQDGKKVQEIRLPSKVVTQRLAWALLVLAFVLPWLLSHYVMVNHIRELKKPFLGDQLQTLIEDNAPLPPEVVTANAKVVPETIYDGVDRLKSAVNYLHLKANDHPDLPTYVGTGTFVLSLISAFFHRQKRSRRTGKPIPVPKPDADEDEDEDDEPAPRRRGQAAEVEVV
jgi:hypothetical protein